MSDKRYQGNIIRKTPVTPANGFSDTPAPGVWSLAEALTYTKAGIWPSQANGAAQIGLVMGGENPSATDTVQKIIVNTAGNATDYGDLLASGVRGAGFSNSTRAIFGASSYGGTTYSNVIQYKAFSSSGNFADFGDLSNAARRNGGGASNYVRGLFYGGYDGSNVNHIDYVTIASTGNAADFGDGTARRFMAGCASTLRALFGGGYEGTQTNTIDYVTISSAGNMSDFGDLTVARSALAGFASTTRGCFAGGSGGQNVIDYVTIASTGNATDFGDMTRNAYEHVGFAGTTLGLMAGNTGGGTNAIDQVTIASAGNATDFGDLAEAVGYAGACCSATGSVQSPDVSAAIGLMMGGSNMRYSIQFINIATTGNAQAFGDLNTVGGGQIGGAGSSSTRAVYFGGEPLSGNTNTIQYTSYSIGNRTSDFGDMSISSKETAVMDNETRAITTIRGDVTLEYITIASLGNTTDFGDHVGNIDRGTATASATRGVLAQGYSGAYTDTLGYVTIASTGNTSDFGNLSVARSDLTAFSSNTRGCYAGGYTGSDSNVIDYITIASTGNATDFGDLSVARTTLSSVSSGTRGATCGGSSTDVIDYVTIASTGNATDFGDMPQSNTTQYNSGTSNAHGGL